MSVMQPWSLRPRDRESTHGWCVVLLVEYDTPATINETVVVETRHVETPLVAPWLNSWMERRIFDVGLGIVVALFAVVVLAAGLDTDTTPSWSSFAVAGIAGLALIARRDAAIAVLVVVASGRLFVMWATGDDLAVFPAAAIALYTVARHGQRWASVLIASFVAVIIGAGAATLGDETILTEAPQSLLPVAVADAMRTRTHRLRDLIDAEAEARLQAERLRIARDLHDVVAHGLSTIAIQSGVAARLIDRDKEQARNALEAINEVGKSSLDELRGLLGVLRSSDGPELRPTPSSPDDLGEILRHSAELGVVLSHDVHGTFPSDVSDSAVVAVHRIVQEALTNVRRHAGSVPTSVRLEHRAGWVDVEIRNDRPSEVRQSAPSTGVGIIGMRERAESLGGSLDVGPTPDGGFRVSARVPYVKVAS